MQIERILPTDSGKVAFEKTDRNMGFISDGLADRGYDYTKDIGTAHIDTLLNNGKYSGNPQGMPVTGMWCVNVTNAGSWVRQDASCLYDNIGKGFTGVNISRTLMDGVWSKWFREVSDADAHIYSKIGNAPSISDFNNMLTPMHGSCIVDLSVVKNAPFASSGVVRVQLEVVVDEGTHKVINQRVYYQDGAYYKRIFYRTTVNGGTSWTGWFELGVSESAFLTLNNGWVNELTTGMAYKVGRVVHVDAMIANGTISTGTLIATLPVGYRPSTTRYVLAWTSYAYTPILLFVYPDGTIKLASAANSQRLVMNFNVPL